MVVNVVMNSGDREGIFLSSSTGKDCGFGFTSQAEHAAASKPMQTLTTGTGTSPTATFSSSGSQPGKDGPPGAVSALHDKSTLDHVLGISSNH